MEDALLHSGTNLRLARAMWCLLFVGLLVHTGIAAEEIFADEGGTVVLPCEVNFDSSKSLFWEIIQHHEDRSIQILTKFPESQGFEIREPRYRGRLSLLRGNSLEISRVARDDDSVDSTDRYVLGSYRCTQGGVRGQEWTLRVRHSPDPPSDLRVHDIHPYAFDVTFRQGEDDGGYPQTPSVRVFQDQLNIRSFSDYSTVQNGKVTFRIQDPNSIRPNTSYRVCALAENRLGHSPCVWATVTTDALSSFKASLRLVNEPYISPDPSADENKDLLERVRNLARNLPLLVWRGHQISPPEVLGFGPGTDEPNPRSVIAHLKVTAGRSSLGEVKTALRAAIMNGRLSEFNVDSHYIRINGNVTMLPSVERPAPLPPDGLKTRDIVLISLGVAIVTILIAVLVICLVRSGKHRGYKRLDTTACSISNVPLPTAGYFETEDFRRLEETVDKEKVVFVHGPSGSGKSEAASKIAESFQMRNPSYITRFFGGTKDDVEGLSEATVDQDLRELAKELEQPTDRESALVDIVYDSLNALAANGVKILLIFDDVQNISVVPREFLRNLKGVLKVIVTTRDSNLHTCNGKPFPSHAMSRFSDEEVVAFMNPAVGEDRAAILELAQHFDCRPHGLSLARSHLMAAVGTDSTERYLRELRSRMNGQADAQLSDPEQVVYKAVELSVTNRMGEIEATMLKMSGFLMQNDIPILILDHAYKMQFGTDPSTDEFVKALKSLSLGKIQEDRRSSIGGAILTLSVHRQTQAALKRMVSKDETLVMTMLEALVKAFLVFFNKDTRGFQASVHNSRLLPHVEVLMGHPMMNIIREKSAFQTAFVRLYEIAAHLYTQRQQAQKAKEMVERAKKICKEICPMLAHETLDDKTCSELVKTGERIFRNDVYAQLMTHQLLTYPNIKVLRAELHDRGRPKLMQQVSFNAKHCEPLKQLQLQKLVQENAAYDKPTRKRSFLVELVASVFLTSGQRALHLKETKEDLKDAAKDFALSMKLSDYLAKNYNLYILNKMLCLRDGTLRLLQELNGKTEVQQRKDLHKAIAGYRELFQDPTDYFENGILKKTDQDDYHAMKCFQFIGQCYRKLIPLASTDKERQDLIDQHNESADNMVKFAEGYKGYNDSGKVVEVFKALPDIYTMRGDFLVEMCEQGLRSGSVKPALEDAKKSFSKVFKIKYVTEQQRARARLGLANASLVLYEKEGRKRENLKRAEEELKKFTDIAANVSANREDRERAEKLKLRIRHFREGSVTVAMAPVALNSTPPDLLRGSVVVEMISSL